MKNYVLSFALAISCPLILCAASSDNLHDAIEASDVPAVKKFLKRAVPLDKRTKKALLEAAEDAVDARKEGIGIFRSRRDLCKLVGGLTLQATGIVFGVAAGIGFTKKQNQEAIAAAGLGLLTYGSGLYLGFSGFFCQTAKARYAAARKIMDEIKRAEDSEPTEQCKA